MSFSSDVKKELNKINNYNKDIFEAELLGYLLSGNTTETEKYFEIITENEFNIEHLYKILFNLNIEYEPETKGKCYVAQINKKIAEEIMNNHKNFKGEIKKNIVKGAFLGAGSINNPEKNYHVEISFNNKNYGEIISQICQEYNVNTKIINVNNRYQLYIKDGEEIANFLALIGANQAVLKFEDIRVIKEMKNKINRKVNCETANLSKTVEAAISQTRDIEYLKKINKFNQLSPKLKEIANLRLENPELSLKDLSKLLEPPIGKSAVNGRFRKIHEIAEELK